MQTLNQSSYNNGRATTFHRGQCCVDRQECSQHHAAPWKGLEKSTSSSGHFLIHLHIYYLYDVKSCAMNNQTQKPWDMELCNGSTPQEEGKWVLACVILENCFTSLSQISFSNWSKSDNDNRVIMMAEDEKNEPGIVVHSTWEVTAGRWWAWCQPKLHSETLSQKKWEMLDPLYKAVGFFSISHFLLTYVSGENKVVFQCNISILYMNTMYFNQIQPLYYSFLSLASPF
jgi:hypothetical protein